MKKTLLIGSILLSATLTKINAQTFAWAKNIGGTGSDVCTDLVTDAAGNIYSTGYFNGTVDFDPGAGTTNLTSAGGTDIFISKLDASGNFAWALKMGGTTGDEAYGIALDAAGNIYTTGTFHGTVDFDPGAGVANLGNAAGGDVFISKLTSAGAYVWVKQFGGNSNDHIGNDICTDAAGNVYTTGQFEGIIDFDPGASTVNLGNSSGAATYFLSKLDSSGNYVWAKHIGNASSVAFGMALATTAAGEVYTTGFYQSTSLDFDPGTGSLLLSSGNYDIFINKFTAAGNFTWVKKLGGPNNDEGLGLTLDASGNVYTTGFFYGTADFDPSASTANMVSAGLTDIYVNKLDALGNYMWAKRIGGSGDDYGYDVTLDALGGIYSTGFFNTTADFDPGAGTANLVAVNNRDAYISKLDASGNYSWGLLLGGTGVETGNGIAVTQAGAVYTGGYFGGAVDFDPTAGTSNLSPVGSNDIFIQKMDQCLIPVAPVNSTAAANLTICYNINSSLSVTGVGTLGWYSASTGGTYLGSGANYSTGNLTSTTSYFVQDSLCSASPRIQIDVTVNPEIISSLTGQTDLLCNAQSTGTATVTASGGTGTLTYAWAPAGGTSAATTGIPAGSYTCTITDAATCTSVQTVTLTEPTGINPSTSSTTSVTCNGGNDGSASVLATGGTPSYTYSWTPSGGNAATAIGLSAGLYTCVVTDANSCAVAQIIGITEPAAINVGVSTSVNTITANQSGATYQWIDCNNGNAIISGETAQSFTALINGDYAVIVTQGSCSDTSSCTNIIVMGIQNAVQNALAVFPNPAHATLTINTTENIEAIFIYSLTGTLMQTENKNSFSVEQLPAGMYFLKVKTAKGISAMRITKE